MRMGEYVRDIATLQQYVLPQLTSLMLTLSRKLAIIRDKARGGIEMGECNGHRSWNAWNVALWIGNDEGLYRFAMDCLDSPPVNRKKRGLAHATRLFMRELGGTKTPDGAIYNTRCVLEALTGLSE